MEGNQDERREKCVNVSMARGGPYRKRKSALNDAIPKTLVGLMSFPFVGREEFLVTDFACLLAHFCVAVKHWRRDTVRPAGPVFEIRAFLI
jgi:hypothetical protein